MNKPKIRAVAELTKKASLKAPGAALKEHFGFSAFLDGQEEVISEIVSGRDGLVVMPTGGGIAPTDAVSLSLMTMSSLSVSSGRSMG